MNEEDELLTCVDKYGEPIDEYSDEYNGTTEFRSYKGTEGYEIKAEN